MLRRQKKAVRINLPALFLRLVYKALKMPVICDTIR
nr:MAG TPA: hypothetical protein [Caudoviricetes sp.]